MRFEDSDGTQDLLRIIKHLYLSPKHKSLVKSAMRALEENSGDMVKQARAYLDTLDVLDQSLFAEMSTANSALIKADVLEYTPDARSKGMLIQKYTITQQLADLLELKANLRPIEDMFMLIGVKIPQNYPPTLRMYRN